jgi:superfamily II DNA or RNA helicase
MSYFSQHYQAVRFPEATESSAGLRRPQIGAVHAIAAYFSRFSQPEEAQPAIIIMPTGSGKTAVLMLAPFILKSKRALVITPSDLVRAQVANQFRGLEVLKRNGALVGALQPPKVELVKSRLADADSWDALKDFQVVVSTPNCTSPIIEGVSNPPADLFDLLLIDEAHHVPAKTWTGVMDAFPKARKVLFTATPFRHDEKAIRGEVIYEFSIREAYKDKIFGPIAYIPVDLDKSPSIDIAIAKTAETIYRQDQAAGYDHFLLIRTDTRVHARELVAIYQQNTALCLRLIHSKLSPKTVHTAVQQLLQKELDGIICVDMLGEGFDFPNLKIAAIHRPHKSFPVTLQFIGRFARTGDDKLGKAKFIAVEQNIKLDMEHLYKEGKIWQEIVPDLYQKRILAGEKTRKQLETFTPLQEDVLVDLSLDDFSPLQHVKVYRLPGGANLDKEIQLKEIAVLKQYRSVELSALTFITEKVDIPDWSSTEVFKQVYYDLFVVYYHAPGQLLFINSSRRLDSLYNEIAQQIALKGEAEYTFEPVPVWEIDRVLRSLKDPCFFNIGMVNRLAASHSESYRIIAGPRAQRALLQTDGRVYYRGHIYGRGGDEDEHPVMLGYSSSSRVWSNRTESIPGLVDWCRSLAENIAHTGPVVTGSGLDVIPLPGALSSIPANVWFAGWHEKVYQSPPEVKYHLKGGLLPESRGRSLLDFDLSIVDSSENHLRISICNEDIAWQVDFLPLDFPWFQAVKDNQAQLSVKRGFLWIDMVEYLNNYPLMFLTTTQDVIQGRGIIPSSLDFQPFLPERVETILWEQEKVNIQYEFGPPKPIKGAEQKGNYQSIHDYLKKWLDQKEIHIVFYDHATGEIADFIAFRLTSNKLHIELYHVKGSGGAKPSSRVGDIYEVSGQVIKSMVWLREDRLLERIAYRNQRGHPFIKGDLDELAALFAEAEKKNIIPCYQIVIVQPGLSQSAMADKDEVLFLLASADDYLSRCSCEPLRVIGSNGDG